MLVLSLTCIVSIKVLCIQQTIVIIGMISLDKCKKVVIDFVSNLKQILQIQFLRNLFMQYGYVFNKYTCNLTKCRFVSECCAVFICIYALCLKLIAVYSCILPVNTVALAPSVMVAGTYSNFSSSAMDIVQPDCAVSLTKL